MSAEGFATTCVDRLLFLENEVQRLEKELFDATQPKPGMEYKVFYKDSFGQHNISHFYYESVEHFTKAQGDYRFSDAVLIMPTGRQKYE